MCALALAFGLTALVYASIGFGGGSTYTALLVVSDVDYHLVPIVSLTCNIVVVAGGAWCFTRAGHVPWRRAWPLFLASVPCAWLGGSLVVSREMFLAFLGSCLLASGLLMLWGTGDLARSGPSSGRSSLLAAAGTIPGRIGRPPTPVPFTVPRAVRTRRPPGLTRSTWVTSERSPVLRGPSAALLIGAFIGFASGVAGVGGGIFLAPLLYMGRWGLAREIAGTASAFILVNSLAGLVGQVGKAPESIASASSYAPLVLCVALGGQVGSRLGVAVLPAPILRFGTAVLVLIVGVRLLSSVLIDRG